MTLNSWVREMKTIVFGFSCSFSVSFTDVLPEFASISTENPNCVVMGDCNTHFTYSAMNAAFNALLSMSPKDRKLYSMGGG